MTTFLRLKAFQSHKPKRLLHKFGLLKDWGDLNKWGQININLADQINVDLTPFI
jgi:hypothetical protein